MILRKYRWSKVYESAEEELQALLHNIKVTYSSWEALPGQVFEYHVHIYDKTVWCAEGSIVFEIDNQKISLQPGDALDLPANTMHAANAGLGGCVCYEAQRL